MNEETITSAKYLAEEGENVCIEFVIDGVTMHVNVDEPNNRHYAEIMRQVDAGTLTIEESE